MSNTTPDRRPSPLPGVVPVSLAGREVLLRGDRTAYLPDSRVLILADLHLGKAEVLQSQGLAVPRGSEEDDLKRLSAAVREAKPSSVVILGDLFHDPRGLTREREAELAQKVTNAAGVPVTLLLGNHDRWSPEDQTDMDIPVRLGPLLLGGFALQHHPPGPGEALGGLSAASRRPSIAGHLHPVTRVAAPGERLRLPCFLLKQSTIVLPAFGSATGGALFRGTSGFHRIAILDGALLELDGTARF